MKPTEVSHHLKMIASNIDNTPDPDKQKIIKDIRSIVAKIHKSNTNCLSGFETVSDAVKGLAEEIMNLANETEAPPDHFMYRMVEELREIAGKYMLEEQAEM